MEMNKQTYPFKIYGENGNSCTNAAKVIHTMKKHSQSNTQH